MRKLVAHTSVIALAAVIVQAPALGANTQSFIDLQAGAGYSSNPLLATGDRVGSGFGRLSAYGVHGWNSERSSTSLSAFVENSFYFRGSSNKQAFSLGATTARRVTETMRVFGSLSFSGDIGGQLSSRFYAVPSIPQEPVAADVSTTAAASVATGPTALVVPTSVVVVDPILLGTSQRIYRLSGDVGADFMLSPLSSLSTTASAQHVFTKDNFAGGDYTLYNGSLGYNRQLSERVSVGGRLIGSYSDYTQGRFVSSVGPQATISARLGPNWTASAAAGFVRTHFDGGTIDPGSSSTINLAVDGNLCREAEFDRFCAAVARRTQAAVYGGSPTSTSATVNYWRRLSAKDQVQASFAAVRTGNSSRLGTGTGTGSNFYTLSASYDRQVGDRLAAGVSGVARKLTLPGTNPKSDVGGTIFLRYRLGDLR